MESKELEAILNKYLPDGWNGNMREEIEALHTLEVERVKSDLIWCMGKLRGLGHTATHLEKKYDLQPQPQKGNNHGS